MLLETWWLIPDSQLLARPLQSSFCWPGRMPLQATGEGIQLSDELISAICHPYVFSMFATRSIKLLNFCSRLHVFPGS